MFGNGSLYVTVKNDKGAFLPEVAVWLTGGIIAPNLQITNNQGQCRYLNIPQGSYTVTAQLDGYSPTEQPAEIYMLRTTTILFELQPVVSEQ